MNPEQPPIDGTPPRKATLTDALEELYRRESGPDDNPDGYLYRHAPPTPKQKAHRGLAVTANQIENLN